MDRQKTLKDKITITGVGLHTGDKVTITILPASENHGYMFKRIDLPGHPTVSALVDYVVSTERGTTLEQNGVRVCTTEHVLASLYGMEIDNAIIELDGVEVPILDGSSQPFIDAIETVGIIEQNAEKKYFTLTENLAYEDVENGIEMLAVPQDEFRVTVMVDYQSPLLGTQHASLYNIREFKKDFAGCRTFVFLREVEALYNKGLIKGGDVDNAIVMVDTQMSDEKLNELRTLFNKPNLEVQGLGFLNNVELKFENEPARHKLLDIVGDFALVGAPIKAHILAARPGHKGNIAFAKMFREMIKKDRKSTPKYDVNKDPVYDINDISRMLPHRYPFLLVDKIIDIGEDYVVGVKNVTANEHFFQGHFPGSPVMPGVLIVEAMAQTGGILILSSVPDPENYLTYFMKIEQVKFKQKVLPGDTIVFKLQLINPIRRGICYMQASAFVGDKLVCEGELMAQVVKVKNNEKSAAGIHSS